MSSLRYPRLQVARAGILTVDTAGRRSITIGGFGSPDVLLLDLSNARQPKVVERTFIDQGADGYRVSASVGKAPHSVLAVERARAFAVKEIVDDVAALGNGQKLLMVTAFTCLAGQFGFPGQESLSELLMVTPDGGAVAVWAPSGLSEHTQARLLDEAFYGSAFGKPGQSIGETI